jgi:uroporphyrinogen-III decarboxylase
VMSGLNLNSVIIPPAIFSKYLTGPIHERAKKLEARGKLLATHPDGENSGLLGEYIRSGMHVADSICPSPMTRLSLKEVRDVFGDKIAIIGGIPSISLLASSMGEAEFERYVDELLQSLNGAKKLVLSIADTTPPDAELSRLKYIQKKAQEIRVQAK